MHLGLSGAEIELIARRLAARNRRESLGGGSGRVKVADFAQLLQGVLAPEVLQLEI